MSHLLYCHYPTEREAGCGYLQSYSCTYLTLITKGEDPTVSFIQERERKRLQYNTGSAIRIQNSHTHFHMVMDEVGIKVLQTAPSLSYNLKDILTLVTKQLRLEIEKEMEENGKISDFLLETLYAIYGPPLVQALDCIDRQAITHITCPAGRGLYQVKASGGSNKYLCLLSVNYCSCPYFVYGIVVREEAMMCKHLLAVHLACSLGQVGDPQIVSDETFTSILNTNCIGP